MAQWATWMTGNIFVPLSSKKIFLCQSNFYGIIKFIAHKLKHRIESLLFPLLENHSLSALEYFVKDSKASLIIGTEASSEKLNELSKNVRNLLH